MPKLGKGMTLGNTEDNFRFLDNTQNRNSQTVSLAEILFLYRNGMCWWPHKQWEDRHLLQTGLSSLLFVIFTFPGTQKQGKY